ncbi:hypothetical protein [Pseudomonas sp. FP1742]|uniref:hypothetical protein n=1 Tax=Pseudomonas sp. FP1742 TaxID=2954079 RepID=UPI002733AB20|nr:hypothetical protein [Pseudomonas sp. FP1742]WLG53635.1 hypothetical protein PSH64_14345 [Pseudomonas sp. FP1742]
MYWFRRHRQRLLRLILAGWVVAVAVMAIQGCLVQPIHNLAAPHTVEQHVLDGHALHANGCLQNCEDTATAIKPGLQTPALDPAHWAALLLLTAAVMILVLDPEQKSSHATLVLKRPAPPESPVRLMFLRFND